MSGFTTVDGAAELRCPHCNSLVAVDATVAKVVNCSACGGTFRLTDLSDLAALDEARLFDRFQMLDRIGRGGFGAVWRARDKVLDRIVALKIPHAGLLDNASILERFRREGRAVAQLRHPGIVTVHEILDLDGLPVIVSDFISGIPLRDLLEQRRLSFRESANIAAEVALALDYAHSRGLVHRDVKPANVMMEFAPPVATTASGSPTGSPARPLLVDFGLALREDAEIVMTIDGQLVGTPAYMSPEQARGEGHHVDGRSDVYSLGVMLYQLLCGELPFRGSRAMLLHQVLNEPPRPPRRVNDRIPRDLETICLKAMAKEPGWRYAKAVDLAADLQRFLRGEPVQARPIGRFRRGWMWCWRNKSLAVASALAACTLACLLVLSLVFAIRERHHARQLELQLAESHVNHGLALCDQNDGSQGILWLARGLRRAPPEAEPLRHYARTCLGAWHARQCSLQACLARPKAIRAAAFCPEGTTCLILDADGGGTRWNVATGEASPLRGRTPERVYSAVVGPAIAVTCHDRTVRRWRLPDLDPLGPPLHHGKPVKAVALSPDGSSIVACGDNLATLWKEQAGEFRRIVLRHDREVQCVALCPQGKCVVTADGDLTARLWDASGNLVARLPHGEPVASAAFSPDGTILVTGCYDGSVHLWDPRDGKSLDVYRPHALIVRPVAISPDNRFVVTASVDKTVRLWSLESKQPIGSPLVHTSEVKAVAIAPDGSFVLTAAEDGSCRSWSLPSREDLGIDLPGGGWMRSIAFSPDGKTILTGGGGVKKKGAGRLFDGHTGKLISTPLIHEQFVVSVAYSSDNRTIVSAGSDGTARLADAKTGKPGWVLRHGGPVHFAAFNPEGDLVLTGSEDLTAQLWVTKTGQPLGKPLPHEKAVMAGGFHPSGGRFFTTSLDGNLCLWRTADQSLLHSRRYDDPIVHATFSHDGTTLVVASGNSAYLLDAQTGDELTPPLRHQATIRAVSFHPEGRLVLTAGDDGRVRLWQVATGAPHGAPLLHGISVGAATFSPDGRLVLTGASDGKAQLWDVATGRKIGPPLRHKSRAYTALFSPDGTRFVTGSTGGTSRLWKTPTPFEGTPDEVVRRVEVQTGLALDEREGLKVLDVAAWQERREAVR